jgi:hypothetical protein
MDILGFFGQSDTRIICMPFTPLHTREESARNDIFALSMNTNLTSKLYN